MGKLLASLQRRWERFWMSVSGLSGPGRIATRLAALFAPPYMARFYLARVSQKPYIDANAVIHHGNLDIESNAFIADRVIVYQASGGREIRIHPGAHILRDSVLETGQGGRIDIGADTFLHPRCQVMAYKGNVMIGDHVAVAPGCAFYAYNHGVCADELIKKQDLETRGGISVGDGAWLGFGVIVLDGVSIGEGAVIGAGSVVTSDVPDNAIAVGNPARVVAHRANPTGEG